MKKTLVIFSLFLGLLFCPNISQAESDKISDYKVDIFVNQDSSIKVEEIIAYDFGDNYKHGIYREIPLSDSVLWPTKQLDISDISVHDQKGQPYQFDVSTANNLKTIKIGDPNQTVSGEQVYVIKYQVKQAIDYYDDHDELYWDAIGNNWIVPILNSQLSLHFYEPLAIEQFKLECYFGQFGSSNKCVDKNIYSGTKDKLTDFVFQADQLSANSGVTVRWQFDKGLVLEPNAKQKVILFLKQYALLFLPFLALILMFFYWYKRGRDPKGRGTIIAQYEPPADLMPAEAGIILDEKANSHDISAEIILLAIWGYIKISRIEKTGLLSSTDYLLEKIKDENDLPRGYQKELMANLFSNSSADKKPQKIKNIELTTGATSRVLMSDFKNKAYKWIKIVEDGLYKSVVDKKYFPKNPHKIKSIHAFIVASLCAVLIGFFRDVSVFANLANLLATGFTFVILYIFSLKMPRRTKEGVLVKEYLLGLKEYINVAEKDRIAFHNAPEKNPALFEKLLPYAMAFGLEKKWAKQFEGIYTEEPNWYHGASTGAYFSAASFGDSLKSFSSSSGSTLSSSSSSSGGVGGGGGGGGGGSW
ncbi:MAG: DUF2207 domain-containing protein [Patescibacteria group bacterium]